MNLKKIILVVGGISLLGTPLFLIAIGAVDLPTRLKPENLVPLNEWLGKKNAKLPSENCDQSATTTPCEALNVLQAQGAAQPRPDTPQPPVVDMNLPENGPLVHTYVDEALGFSFKYPDGFEVTDGDYPGQKKLMQPGATKGGTLIIDTYGSIGLSAFAQAKKPQSLNDFQAAETKLPVNGYGGRVSYVGDVTTNNTISVLPSGVEVLSQMYSHRLYDASGKDVTDRECEECGARRRYVLFKNPQNYITIISIMSEVLEKRIIQSIEYK